MASWSATKDKPLRALLSFLDEQQAFVWYVLDTFIIFNGKPEFKSNAFLLSLSNSPSKSLEFLESRNYMRK
jgi:hypothetical protein